MDLSLEAIKHRNSVRSFNGQPLDSAEILALEAAFDECSPGPFGGTARFVLVSASAAGFIKGAESNHSISGKIGTYGLVTKVPAFLVGSIRQAPWAFEDFGYSMEGLVLRCTDLGLDSCWIGGVFDRSAAGRALSRRDDEFMPAIVAIGRPAEKANMAVLLVRMAARADTRKPFGTLFFDGDFSHGLSDMDPWFDVLDAVRLGPSASNKQPWRIVRDLSSGFPRFHLYLEEDKIYNSLLGETKIQNVDMGIAMRHFEAAAHALGLPGSWKREDPEPISVSSPKSYISTWDSSEPTGRS